MPEAPPYINMQNCYQLDGYTVEERKVKHGEGEKQYVKGVALD